MELTEKERKALYAAWELGPAVSKTSLGNRFRLTVQIELADIAQNVCNKHGVNLQNLTNKIESMTEKEAGRMIMDFKLVDHPVCGKQWF